MDGTAAINSNHQALKRILAGLVAMAGLRGQFTFFRQEGSNASDAALAEKSKLSPPLTLPRQLRLVILRLLRPAESAARRLIIAAARGMVLTLPPPRKARPAPKTMEPVLRSLGIAVVMSPAGLARAARSRRAAAIRAARPRSLDLPLIDPPRRLRVSRRCVPTRAVPRILFLDAGAPVSLPRPQSPDDLIDSTRLGQRLAALAAALDDLPAQARRFARRQARRDAAQDSPAAARFRRPSPLRPGRPPGGRLARYDPTAVHPRSVREVDEILAHAHALALYALQYPDTS